MLTATACRSSSGRWSTTRRSLTYQHNARRNYLDIQAPVSRTDTCCSTATDRDDDPADPVGGSDKGLERRRKQLGGSPRFGVKARIRMHADRSLNKRRQTGRPRRVLSQGGRYQTSRDHRGRRSRRDQRRKRGERIPPDPRRSVLAEAFCGTFMMRHQASGDGLARGGMCARSA